jgi:hypothetical protein
MDEQAADDRQLTDFDDPDRGPDDERVESGEEAIGPDGRNPTQRAIDAEGDGRAPADFTRPA